MMNMELFSGEPFAAHHLPASVQMIIERNRADVSAAAVLFQNSMQFADSDRGITQMFQNLGHHYCIEARILKVDGGSKIHFRTGKTSLARDFQCSIVNVHADPANKSHHSNEGSAAASHIQAQTSLIVAVSLQPATIEGCLDLFVLRTDFRVVIRRLRYVGVMLVEFPNQTVPAVWLVQQQLLRESVFAAHHLSRANLCPLGDCHYLGLGIARKIKLPSQSGFATPSRYPFNDSTEELARRLLYEPSAFCQRSCQYTAALMRG